MLFAVAGALLCACAFTVPAEPARLARLPAGPAASSVVLARDTELRLSTGYTRTLPANSRWQAIGLLPQGTVYQRIDGVFSIEGRHVHEAYLVVHESALRGFYLPGEASFAPLTPSVSLPLGAP
jgi:hypothetical protein